MTTKKALISWQVYLGLVLLITGGLFLADQLLELGLMFFLWPLLIVLFGITFFVGMSTAGKRETPGKELSNSPADSKN